jgi:hypothetical protein
VVQASIEQPAAGVEVAGLPDSGAEEEELVWQCSVVEVEEAAAHERQTVVHEMEEAGEVRDAAVRVEQRSAREKVPGALAREGVGEVMGKAL